MNDRKNVALVAGAAVLLSCAPLAMLFTGLFEWFLPIALTVSFIIGTAIGIRALRRGTFLQMLGMGVALLLSLTWIFGKNGKILGILPGWATFEDFSNHAQEALTQITNDAPPVTPTPELIFIAVLSVGICAIATYVFAINIESVPLAGIPLFALYAVPVAALPDSLPWVFFIPGALGYLWLLMTDNIVRIRGFGRHFSGRGEHIASSEPSPLATHGRWLTAIVIPLALVTPMMLPGVNGGLLNLFSNNQPGIGPGSGSPHRVDPIAALQGALDSSDITELARVTTNAPSPGYLKMYVASTLTAEGFQANLAMSPSSVPATGNLPLTPSEAQYTERTASFTSIALDDYALPLFSEPSNLDVGSTWNYDPQTSMVASSQDSTNDMEFQYSYYDYDYAPDDLRNAPEPADTEPVVRSNLPTPDSSMLDETVTEVTTGITNRYDKVMAIQDFFSEDNGFSYKLETKTGWNTSAIESFLTNREGFCQQYSGAMAWMVRAAGIPARVAIGLTSGTPIANDQYRLTNFNFHAWVEVYFKGYGWVPFDPTPSSSVRGATEFPWAPDVDQENNETEQRPDENNDEEILPGTGPDPSDPLSNPNANVTTNLIAADPIPVVWLASAIAFIVFMLVMSPALTRLLRRRKRLKDQPDDPQTAAVAAWDEVRDSLIDVKAAPAASLSPRAHGSELIGNYQLTGRAEAAVTHLVGALERAMYAKTPPTNLELKSAVVEIREGISHNQSAIALIRSELWPQSVISPWRRAIRDNVRAFLNKTYVWRYQLRQAMLKPFTHRRTS